MNDEQPLITATSLELLIDFWQRNLEKRRSADLIEWFSDDPEMCDGVDELLENLKPALKIIVKQQAELEAARDVVNHTRSLDLYNAYSNINKDHLWERIIDALNTYDDLRAGQENSE